MLNKQEHCLSPNKRSGLLLLQGESEEIDRERRDDFRNLKSLEHVIEEQGSRAIENAVALRADFWPEEEPVDKSLTHNTREPSVAIYVGQWWVKQM